MEIGIFNGRPPAAAAAAAYQSYGTLIGSHFFIYRLRKRYLRVNDVKFFDFVYIRANASGGPAGQKTYPDPNPDP